VEALNNHHDTPPYPVTPSPTSGHSSPHAPVNAIEDVLQKHSGLLK
jgi:hypothetical protein